MVTYDKNILKEYLEFTYFYKQMDDKRDKTSEEHHKLYRGEWSDKMDELEKKIVTTFGLSENYDEDPKQYNFYESLLSIGSDYRFDEIDLETAMNRIHTEFIRLSLTIV